MKHPIHPSCVCVRAHLSVDALGLAPNKKVKRGLVITTISDKNILGNSPLSRTFRFEHRGEARTHTRLPQHGRTLSSTRVRTQRSNSVCDSARGCPAAMSKHPEQQQDATDSAGRLTRASPASPTLQSSHPALTFYTRAFPQALIASVQRRSCGAYAAPPRRQRQRPLCMSRHAVARRGCHRSPSHRGLRTSRQLPTAAVPLDLLDYQSHSPWRSS